MKCPILSYRLRELYDNRDPLYLRKDERTDALEEPKLVRAYASTLKFLVKSSNYASNGKSYEVYVLLEDFMSIASDKQISLEDAVHYVLENGDVHVSCSDPSFLYWGWRYISTQLVYLYGVPLENRRPERNNVELRSTYCKHINKVIQWMMNHESDICEAFREYYTNLVHRHDRLEELDTMKTQEILEIEEAEIPEEPEEPEIEIDEEEEVEIPEPLYTEEEEELEP